MLFDRKSKCRKRCKGRNASLEIWCKLLSPKRKYWRFSEINRNQSYTKCLPNWQCPIFSVYLLSQQMHLYPHTISDYLPIPVNSATLNDETHLPAPLSIDYGPKSVNLNFSYLLNATPQNTGKKYCKLKYEPKCQSVWHAIYIYIYICYVCIDSARVSSDIRTICIPSKSPSRITLILFSCISSFFSISNIDRDFCGTDVNSFPPRFNRFNFLLYRRAYHTIGGNKNGKSILFINSKQNKEQKQEKR